MERMKICGLEKDDYTYVETKEAQRIQKLLRIIPHLTEWTPLFKIAKQMGEKQAATISTVRLLWGAHLIQIEHAYGTETITKSPFLKMRKEKTNKNNHRGRTKQYRAPVYIMRPQYSNSKGDT